MRVALSRDNFASGDSADRLSRADNSITVAIPRYPAAYPGPYATGFSTILTGLSHRFSPKRLLFLSYRTTQIRRVCRDSYFSPF
jgi:hypothetical protein